jgi:hypothetical protein
MKRPDVKAVTLYLYCRPHEPDGKYEIKGKYVCISERASKAEMFWAWRIAVKGELDDHWRAVVQNLSQDVNEYVSEVGSDVMEQASWMEGVPIWFIDPAKSQISLRAMRESRASDGALPDLPPGGLPATTFGGADADSGSDR